MARIDASNSLVFMLLVVGSVGPTWADVFWLTQGGVIQGELQNPDQNPRTSYQVRTATGATFSLKADLVQKVERKTDLERSYEGRVRKLPDTVEAHWEIAKRCSEFGLKVQQQFHLTQILRLQPDHEESRRLLGYSKVDGRWMTRDEWMSSRGYVRAGGAWRLPQEVELRSTSGELESVAIDDEPCDPDRRLPPASRRDRLCDLARFRQ